MDYTTLLVFLIPLLILLTITVAIGAIRKVLRADKQGQDTATPAPPAPAIHWQIKLHFILLWLAIVVLVNQIVTLHDEVIFLRVVLSRR